MRPTEPDEAVRATLDEETATRFLEWQASEACHPFATFSDGGETWVFMFGAANAERARAWLAEHADQ